VPLDQTPLVVRDWFDCAAEAAIPDYDGSIGTARIAAQAYARRAKAENTRRAYRAGVRAWCTWCERHGVACLPARAADVVAFLAAERGQGPSVNTVELRRAAIRYLHSIAGCPVPTAEAQARPWLGCTAPPPMPASCPARNSPPRRTSCARSWRRSKRTSSVCATARCC
jgi:hypothetical protein